MSVKDWLKQLEDRMHSTLALLLEEAVSEDASTQDAMTTEEGKAAFVEWAKKFPAQVMILATLINWSMGVDKALHDDDSASGLQAVIDGVEAKLESWRRLFFLTCPLNRVRSSSSSSPSWFISVMQHEAFWMQVYLDEDDFRWRYHLRYMYNPKAEKLTEKLDH
jgi:dynein heavy chain 1